MENSWNSSYIFGKDDDNGWGERYFFTYYSEFGVRSPSSVAFEVTICCAILILSVVSNISIAVCVLRFPEMRTVTNCLVFNLATADMLLAITIPVVMFTRVVEQWKLGNTACKLVPYIQFVSGVVLLWTLALISMDRHRCVVIPPYRSTISPKQATMLSLLTWSVASVIILPVAFWFREQTSIDGKTVCTLIFPKSENVNYSLIFIILAVLVACLVPMGVLVYNYQMIFHKIISTKNTWASSCVVVSTETMNCNRGQFRRQSEVSLSEIFVPWPRKLSIPGQFNTTQKPRQGSLSQHEEIRVSKHIKVVRILFLNVLLVLVMWLPITILMVLIFVDGRRPTEDTGFFLRSHHFVAALIVAFLNTVVNPLLYGLFSDSFRSCLRKMWCKNGQEDKAKIVKEAATPSSAKMNGGFRKPSFVNSVSDVV